MSTPTRTRIVGLVSGLVLLVSACSSTGDAPDALAFQDDSSSTDTTQDPSTFDEPIESTADRPNVTCSGSDFHVDFPENVWFAAPNRPSFGPFEVSIPEGTYDITVQTWLGFDDLPEHTMEQWFFSTDSGYTAPLSTDSSPQLTGADTFGGQQIPAGTTELTIFHKAQDGTVNNSVHPLCIGFDSVAVPETTTAAPETTTAAPETTEAPAVTETTEAPAEVTETTEAPETAEVAGPTTTAADDGDDSELGAAGELDGDDTTTTTAAAAAAATTTTVAASNEQPAELALTGPGDLSFSLGLAGAALTLAGAAALAAARRQEED